VTRDEFSELLSAYRQAAEHYNDDAAHDLEKALLDAFANSQEQVVRLPEGGYHCKACGRMWTPREPPTTITTQAGHDYALAWIDTLLARDPDPDSADGSELQRLVAMVEAWEREHCKMAEPTIEELAMFRTEQEGGELPLC
jgi:hypothetical protein